MKVASRKYFGYFNPMGVKVYEYLGVRVESDVHISPFQSEMCPFMHSTCSKITGNNKPICSVKTASDDVWIVCKHRLCSTLKNIPLIDHQLDVLQQVANHIWPGYSVPEYVGIKREVAIPVTQTSRYNADYIMVNNHPNFRLSGPRRVVLEMQGGGETSNTGIITQTVTSWERHSNRTNAMLGVMNVSVGTIQTNAWRRQQEQFIIKGNIAMETGGGIVFCVGTLLFDYLEDRFKDRHLNNLRGHNWTLALLTFTDYVKSDGSVGFRIDENRVLYTNYQNFIQVLISQGAPFPGMFEGEFETLNGKSFII